MADNDMLDKPISDKDVKASLLSANRNSSPGSDGITYLVYLTCWKAPRAAPERRHQRDRQGRQVARVHAELLLGVFSKIGERELHQNQGQKEALAPPDRLQGSLRDPGWAPQEDRESHHLLPPVLCRLQKGLTSCLSHQECDRVCEAISKSCCNRVRFLHSIS